MIIMLLVVTFFVAVLVSTAVVFAFSKPILAILNRVVPPELSYAWARYLRFAMYVVGIGGGVNVWQLERYATPQEPLKEVLLLTPDRWMLEIYNTIIGTLSSTAILLLVFFVFALLAVVIVRLFEGRGAKMT